MSSQHFYLITQYLFIDRLYYLSVSPDIIDHIKENETARHVSHVEESYRCVRGNLEERGHLVDLTTDERIIQGDSLARGPKLLSIKNYVNQLTDDELTTGYYQQHSATCHTSNASIREIEFFFFQERIISKNHLATQISRSNACRLLSLGPIEGQSVQK